MAAATGKDVLLAPVGSLGDLFPMLGLAKALRDAGASCRFASCREHIELIKREGFLVHEIPTTTQGEYAAANMKFAQGSENDTLWREVLLPQLSEGIDALLPLVKECDVVVGGFVSLSVPAAAELAGKPWVSLQLTGLPLLSATDPPVHPSAASKLWQRGGSPLVWRIAQSVGGTDLPRQTMRNAGGPLRQERLRRGLEPGDGDVTLETISPYLTLGMFPKQLWPPQPDWPASMLPLGPISYDNPPPALWSGAAAMAESATSANLQDAGEPSPELIVFLLGGGTPAASAAAASTTTQQAHSYAFGGSGPDSDILDREAPTPGVYPIGWSGSGPRPLVVFALGSVAVESVGALAGAFASAAKAAGFRALIVAGGQCDAARSAAVSAAALTVGPCDWDVARDVLCVPFAAYSLIFRHASVVVHQGGAGTTARALCAGVPTVVLPLGMDTFDNALRAERIGVSVTLPRGEGFTAGGLAAAIRKAAEPSVRERAKMVGVEAADDERGAVSAAAAAVLHVAEVFGSLSKSNNPGAAPAPHAPGKQPAVVISAGGMQLFSNCSSDRDSIAAMPLPFFLPAPPATVPVACGGTSASDLLLLQQPRPRELSAGPKLSSIIFAARPSLSEGGGPGEHTQIASSPRSSTTDQSVAESVMKLLFGTVAVADGEEEGTTACRSPSSSGREGMVKHLCVLEV